jgi:DNA-binding transcriptional LysR family regulator
MGARVPAAASLESRGAKMNNPRGFDWNDLRFFLAVARHGSTLAAAKALRVSQSTVHRRLIELEKALARQIVARQPTGYKLTEIGQALLPYAAQVETAALALDRQVTGLDLAMIGVLRLACPEALGTRLVRSKLLHRFHSRYPGLRVELVMSTKPLDLTQGDADIAIRFVTANDDKLFGRKLADAPWSVYAARVYVKHYGAPKAVEEINEHPIIVFDEDMAQHHAAVWLKSVAPRARIAATADNISAKVLAAKSGVGLAALPSVVGDNDRDLVRVLGPVKGLVTTAPLCPLWSVVSSDRRNTLS